MADPRRTADALWLFDALMGLRSPIILNATEIGAILNIQPGSVAKRIRDIKKRHRDLSVAVSVALGGRRSVGISLAPAPGAVAPPTSKPTKKGKKGARTAEGDNEDDEERDEGETPDAGVARRQTRSQSRAGSVGASVVAHDEMSVPGVNIKAKSGNGKRTWVKSKVKRKSPIHDAEDLNDENAEKSMAEDEKEKEKSKTPKTRAGRKSAGIEEVQIGSLEKPKARGRYAYMNNNAANDDAEVMGRSADMIDGEDSDAGHKNDGNPDELAPTPAKHETVAESTLASTAAATGTKRKRSITPIRQPDFSSSSPLSNPPATPTITTERSDQTATGASEEEARITEVEMGIETPSKPPPAKKQKMNDEVNKPEQATVDEKQTDALPVAGDGQPNLEFGTVNAQDSLDVRNQESGSFEALLEDAGTGSSAENGLTWMRFNPDAKPAAGHTVMEARRTPDAEP